MATKKYQIQQLQADDSLLTLHPETDASIVKINNSNSTYDNVESAVVGLESRIEQVVGSVGVTGVKGSAESTYRTGQVNITKENIGLGNVDNTSDANKPISTAQKAVNDAQATTNTSLGNRLTALENSVGGFSGAMEFLGTSSTTITDGGTQAPTINGSAISIEKCKSGNVVLYEQQEYIWNGSTWELFGDEGSYVVKTRKINGKALTDDITLTGSDINLTNGTVSQAIFELYGLADDMQPMADNSLPTTAKTVVGAIGEVKTTADNTQTLATTNERYIANILDGTYKAKKAELADKFSSSKSVALMGDVTGSASSQAGWSIATTLKESGVTAGTYSAVTVNAKGIVTAGAKVIEVGGTTPSSSLATGGIFFKEI